jgi:hypothetical protein
VNGVAGAVAAGGPAAIAGWSRVAVAGVPGVAVAGAAAPARVVRAVARVTSLAVRSAVAIAVTVLPPPLPEPGPEPPGLPRRRCGGFPAQPLPVPGHRRCARRRRFRYRCCRRHCRWPGRQLPVSPSPLPGFPALLGRASRRHRSPASPPPLPVTPLTALDPQPAVSPQLPCFRAAGPGPQPLEHCPR